MFWGMSVGIKAREELLEPLNFRFDRGNWLSMQTIIANTSNASKKCKSEQ